LQKCLDIKKECLSLYPTNKQTLYNMEALNLEQIIINNQAKSNEEIALEFNVSKFTVSAKRTWLIRQGKIEGTFKPKAPKKERKDSVLSALSKLNKKVESLIASNTYSNVDGIEKDNCRVKMATKIVESGVYGTILTLPHIACKMEKKILAMDENFDFIGVERNVETYKAMNRTIKKENLPIVPYRGNISDKIYGALRESYAHLILDYCGVLSTFNLEIQYALQNKLVPIGGTYHITFMKNLRASGGVHDIVKDLSKTKVTNGNLDTRSESEVAIRSFFDKVCGFDYELEEIHYYRDIDTEKGTNKVEMCLVQIKRIA